MHLDESSPVPLYQQIYEHFRAGIESGVYPADDKLPSIRGLAEEAGCSRNTVEAAYQLLVQEDFISSRPGSGYRVKETGLFEPSLGAAKGTGAQKDARRASSASAHVPRTRFDFTYGNLQPGTFPAASWRSITDDILLSVERAPLDTYTNPFGEPSLRHEIARRLNAQRSINCTPDQVIVQSGTQSSMQNLLALFNPRSDVVAMEEPGYDGARSVFVRSGFTVAPCGVLDGSGAFLADVAQSDARLVYVTPSSQFPTCMVMPLETRQRLITWAADTQAYILEDDYCRDFRYRERPPLPLRAIDQRERVIYMGTFSKSLSPALRINYLVLPPDLLSRWHELFGGSYSSVPWLSQETVARFMSSGAWDRHLRRLQAKNRRKYETLIEALHEHMGTRVEVMENGTGLHLLVNVVDGRSQDELVALARAADVRVYDTNRYWMAREHPLGSCVLVGFSAIEEADIEPGIAELARAWFN